METKRSYSYLFLIIALFLVFLIVPRGATVFWKDLRMPHEPLHSTVEAIGAAIGLLITVFLFQRRDAEYAGKLFLIAMGFLSMGLLDGLHAVSRPGDGFVLLHSAAGFAGGFWFALTWIKGLASDEDADWKKALPWIVIAGSLLFGFVALFSGAGTLPIMAQKGEFTATAVAINFIGGILFFAAVVRLLLDFYDSKKVLLCFFACVSTLFSVAGLSFSLSTLWDLEWWLWHIERLLAYLMVFGFVVYEHNIAVIEAKMKIKMEEVNKELEKEILERKRVESLLSESEEKYRRFFAAESNAIMLVDADTDRFVDANKAALKLYQYTREEFLQLTPLEISAEPKKIADATKKTAAGRIVGVPLRYHKKKDGAVFPVEISTGVFMLKGRKVLFGVCRDISQRIEEEKKLRAAEKHLMLSEKLAGIGRLSAGICHEILNPLNIISLQTQLLLRSEKNNPALLEKLTKIINEIRRTEKIVGALTTFARKEGADLRPRQINTEIDTVLSLIENDFNLDGIKITRDYQTPLPEIKIDADEMRQVFLNLINNAKYAMSSGGILTIKTRIETNRAAEFLRIYVSDTGVGIKKENLLLIFDPFFTTKPEGEGTGMGLPIAHGIVEKHDGTILVESEEGKGATFIINLPWKR